MTAITLKPEQTGAIAAHLARFKGYLKTDQFRADQEERQRRVAFLREQLPDRLPSISEADLTELVTLLWASSMRSDDFTNSADPVGGHWGGGFFFHLTAIPLSPLSPLWALPESRSYSYCVAALTPRVGRHAAPARSTSALGCRQLLDKPLVPVR